MSTKIMSDFFSKSTLSAHRQSTCFVWVLQMKIPSLQALARYTPLTESVSAVVAPVALGSERLKDLSQFGREMATISTRGGS